MGGRPPSERQRRRRLPVCMLRMCWCHMTRQLLAALFGGGAMPSVARSGTIPLPPLGLSLTFDSAGRPWLSARAARSRYAGSATFVKLGKVLFLWCMQGTADVSRRARYDSPAHQSGLPHTHPRPASSKPSSALTPKVALVYCQ